MSNQNIKIENGIPIIGKKIIVNCVHNVDECYDLEFETEPTDQEIKEKLKSKLDLYYRDGELEI